MTNLERLEKESDKRNRVRRLLCNMEHGFWDDICRYHCKYFCDCTIPLPLRYGHMNEQCIDGTIDWLHEDCK